MPKEPEHQCVRLGDGDASTLLVEMVNVVKESLKSRLSNGNGAVLALLGCLPYDWGRG